MNDNGDTKILLMTYMEEDPGYRREMVSHGVGDNSLQTYVLPLNTLASFAPKYVANQPYIEA